MDGMDRGVHADRLAVERAGTLAQLADLGGDLDAIVGAARDVATDDEHDPEGATIAFERSQVSALIGAATEHLAAVDHALIRLADGTFGDCERCGRAIGDARLEARPTAATCIACASATATR
jgi:DnaK suppressor protein